MKPAPLCVLIVEDSDDDAQLVLNELRRGGYAPVFERVETPAALAAALERQAWDLVISDYRMPEFSGPAALKQVRASGRDLPFIIVSGTVGEELAVEMLKAGADDYLLKDRLGRLGMAVAHELEARRLRQAGRQARQQLVLQTTALETAANAVTITDDKGVILWVNPAFTALSGYAPEEVIGQTPRVLKSGQHGQAFYRELWRTILAGQTWRGEFINRRKDGSHYHGEQTITPVCAQGGAVTHFIGIMNDVTARKRAEAELRTEQQHSQSLLELARKLERALTQADIFKAAQETVAGTLGFHVVWLYLLSDDGKHLKLVASDDGARPRDWPGDGERLLIAGDPMLEEIAAGRGLVVVEDARTDPRTNKAIVEKLGNRTIVNMPIMLSGKNLGSIGAGTFGDEGIRKLTPADCDFFATLASHLAVVLDRVTAFSERQRAETALRESEECLRIVTDNARVGLVLVNPERRYVFANAAYAEVLGLPAESIVGRRVPEVLPEVYEQQIRPRLDRAFAGERIAYELRRSKPEGEHFYAVNYEPIGTGDRVSRVVVVIVDITERKRAEGSLNLFRALLDQSRDLVEVIDPETGRFLDVNESSCRAHGYRREELLAMCVQEIEVNLTDRSRWSKVVEHIRQSGYETIAGRHRRKDGSTFPVEVSCQYVELDRPYLLAVVRDVTERQRAEEELRRTGDLLRAVAAGTNDAVFVKDLAGRYLLFNEAAARFVGRPAAEVIGQDDAALFDPEGAKQVMANDRAVRESGQTQTNEEQLTAAGVARVFLATKAPYRDAQGHIIGTIGISRDITERKQAEAALRASEERFRQLAENISQVFWMTDKDLTQMLYVSPAYETVWGRTCQSAYERPVLFAEAIHPDDRDQAFALVERMKTGEHADGQYRILRPDGAERWIHDRSFAVRNAAGEFYRIAGVAEDVTERKQLEEKFLRAQRMESIGSLAGGIAHDLNNALAPIIMATELLKLTSQAPDGDRILDTIYDSAKRGAGMVRQILTFARGSEGERGSVQPKHLVREMIDITRHTFPKTIQIRTEIANDTRPVVGNPTQLHQILLNLCVNARDAMPAGGTLTLAAGNFPLRPADAPPAPDMPPGEYVLLSVTDTGTGMTPEVRARIFEAFFTTKAPDKGTGLGLSTVRNIVQDHGGHLTVDSTVGKGTTFRVYLPVQAADAESPGPGAAPALPMGRGELILVVDDEAAIRTIATQTLQAFGYRVVTASDGAQAVGVCAQNLAELQLLITDMAMPIMGGKATIRAIHAVLPRLPIIAISGSDSVADPALGKEYDVQAFLRKPFSADDLIRTVHEVLHGAPPA